SFLTFKAEHEEVFEWVFWTAHSSFFSCGESMEAPEDSKHPWASLINKDEAELGFGIDFGDIIALANYEEPKDGLQEANWVKLPEQYVTSEPDATDMNMLILDEEGIQFSCFSK